MKLLFAFLSLFVIHECLAQQTQIRGFADVVTSFEKNKVSFSLGEQDLFITSEISDRFTFLGESVFKFSAGSPTSFDISVERVILKYNFKGNHNLLLGKHHTPLNYWNDTYHHGRVFFPTIFRPLLFATGIIPIHTTGVSVQGHDLGKIKFGYDVMVGNGLGSNDITDNDKRKSITAAVHIKPADNLRIGVSYYNDVISKGSRVHDHFIMQTVKQQLFSASVGYFKKLEILAESTMAINNTDSTGLKTTIASYAYAGIKIKEKFIPYLRYDKIHYQEGDLYFHKDNTSSILIGIRYQVNYLAVIKLEFEHGNSEHTGKTEKVSAQFAIGF
jgi:hypothetical protein